MPRLCMSYKKDVFVTVHAHSAAQPLTHSYCTVSHTGTVSHVFTWYIKTYVRNRFTYIHTLTHSRSCTHPPALAVSGLVPEFQKRRPHIHIFTYIHSHHYSQTLTYTHACPDLVYVPQRRRPHTHIQTDWNTIMKIHSPTYVDKNNRCLRKWVNVFSWLSFSQSVFENEADRLCSTYTRSRQERERDHVCHRLCLH